MSKRPRYTGNPKSDQHAAEAMHDWPWVDTQKQHDPAGYLAPPGLVAAVNVALELGMPLLLTGEPGCGKSRLADSVAHEFGLLPVLRFQVKSDSEGRDLFYRFDTLGRFHAAHNGDAKPEDSLRYLTYQALGQAILLAKGLNAIPENLRTAWAKENLGEARRSVVLIDEIDKAPREVPNDILDEIENLRFTIPELNHDRPIQLEGAEQAKRPVVIFTSNEERELPAAFLRRCIYFHLELPPFQCEGKPGVSVEDIVARRIGERYAQHGSVLQEALLLFRFLRELPKHRKLEKEPALAELLDWLRFLHHRLPQDGGLADHPDFDASLMALLKHRVDRERWAGQLQAEFAAWKQGQA